MLKLGKEKIQYRFLNAVAVDGGVKQFYLHEGWMVRRILCWRDFGFIRELILGERWSWAERLGTEDFSLHGSWVSGCRELQGG